MIQNDEQLENTQGALHHLELALASLRRDILPLNARNFALMAEGVIDDIWKLRGEIDEYLGLKRPIIQDAPEHASLNTSTTE